MLNVKLSFLNLISLHKSKQMLPTSELPSPKAAVNHVVSYQHGLMSGNNTLVRALNPYYVSMDQMNGKAIDVIYSDVKKRTISCNSSLYIDLPVGVTDVFRVSLDKSKSIYFSDGIYNNSWISKHIDVLNNHPCRITRLGNGKVRVSHLTHNPPNSNDLHNTKRGQFISKIGFEFDENMVVGLKIYKPTIHNIQIRDYVINNNYELYNFSEISVFHQIGNKNYDIDLFLEVKEELVVNINEAIELIDTFIK